jgi:tetratricopeptide (TPR) repeat protein
MTRWIARVALIGTLVFAMGASAAPQPPKRPAPASRGSSGQEPAPALRVPFRVARLNRQGNASYKAERYDDALSSYAEAQAAGADLPALRYNVGNALYRKGLWQQAAEEYGRVAASTGEPLARAAAFNEGNVFFQTGRYREAAASYARALTARPSDIDAKRNLELALEKLRQQEQQRQQQQQQQQQQGKQPPSAEAGEKQRSDEGDSSRHEERGEEDGSQRERAGRDQPTAGGEREGGASEDRTGPGGARSSEEERRREGARFSEKQAERLLDALAGDEKSALRRVMGDKASRRVPSSEVAEDW